MLLVKRIHHDDARDATASGGYTQDFVREQFAKICESLADGTLKVENRAASRLLAQTLESLLAIDGPLLDAAWNELASGVVAASQKGDQSHLGPALLKVFYDRFRKTDSTLKEKGRKLMMEVLTDSLDTCEGYLVSNGEEFSGSFAFLVNVLDQFREGLFFDDEFSNVSCAEPSFFWATDGLVSLASGRHRRGALLSHSIAICTSITFVFAIPEERGKSTGRVAFFALEHRIHVSSWNEAGPESCREPPCCRAKRDSSWLFETARWGAGRSGRHSAGTGA